MLAKLDELESELGRLLAALRACGERLVRGPRGAASADVRAVAGERRLPAPVAPEPSRRRGPRRRGARSDGAGVPPDEAGARLIALNMALSGSSREETARYLAEHFGLADPEALLDDVYARAGQ